jgi:hypothetical protein
VPFKKVLNGRAATEADANAGAVVFYIQDSRSKPYAFDHELPLLAKVIGPEDNGLGPGGTEVIVVQAEEGDNGTVLLGVLIGDDGEGICMLNELQILGPVPDSRLRP